MEEIKFNLKYIRELFEPLDSLQGKNNIINQRILELSKRLLKIREDETPITLNSNIADLTLNLKQISKLNSEITKENVKNFISLKDNLIKKYKQIYLERIKSYEINRDLIKSIGLRLIEEKNISRTFSKPSYVPSIPLERWIELLDSLNNNTLFLSSIKKVEKFYEVIKNKRLEKELANISDDVDSLLIEDFKNAFKNNPRLTFNLFLDQIEEELSQKELNERKKTIELTKERKRLESLKKKQEEQQKSYEDYFKYSDKEFQRRRRKKKRTKLSDLANRPSETKELNEDVAEKIKKFKSKFENSFEDKYLIQEDDEKDPLEIIRERKKKKEEEYKDHYDKLKE
ncbi:MAG: hypothetical protein GF317_22415 [Candidatus Lokiarchaeota archaeon]|nr:hypothetical protein [Candidatus Lokiarchaeota archaeon]MBD3202215.1 hypothetical protein [Candidatus Lokiarchaeota archaeon]